MDIGEYIQERMKYHSHPAREPELSPHEKTTTWARRAAAMLSAFDDDEVRVAYRSLFESVADQVLADGHRLDDAEEWAYTVLKNAIEGSDV